LDTLLARHEDRLRRMVALRLVFWIAYRPNDHYSGQIPSTAPSPVLSSELWAALEIDLTLHRHDIKLDPAYFDR
jgi:hypothetical protein